MTISCGGTGEAWYRGKFVECPGCDDCTAEPDCYLCMDEGCEECECLGEIDDDDKA